MASEDLLKKAVAAFNALSPEQQAEMLEEQRQSWVRGNVGLSRDERGMTSPMMRALKIVRETNDKGRQAVQEWADSKTHPAPVAPVSRDATGKCGELETVAWNCTYPSYGHFTLKEHEAKQAIEDGASVEELCSRSQAVELLAAERAEKARLKSENDAQEDQISELQMTPWPEWATKVLAVIRKRSGYDGYGDAIEGVDLPAELDECIAAIEADNAALTARVKRLEELEKYTVPIHADGSHVFIDGPGDVELDHGGKMRQRIKALETQLAAAEKIRIAAIELDAAISDDFNIFGAQQKLRAALGGKPS